VNQNGRITLLNGILSLNLSSELNIFLHFNIRKTKKASIIKYFCVPNQSRHPFPMRQVSTRQHLVADHKKPFTVSGFPYYQHSVGLYTKVVSGHGSVQKVPIARLAKPPKPEFTNRK
jgi:hypothetical protein